MIKKIINNYSKDNIVNYGQTSFYLGILFLPSLLPFGIIFLILALIISFLRNRINLIKDKWDLSLLIISIFIFISSLNSILINSEIESSNNINITINALRWLILFLSFSGFQIYLKTSPQRILFAKVFSLSCIPLLISCGLQYWFEIYGPFNFLNGLIIWYNKPIIGIDQGVAGLFSNQNYTGFWLSILFPFCIFLVFISKKFSFRKISLLILLISTIFFIVMTTSRSAILGLFVSIPIIFSLKIFVQILLILLVMYLLITILPIGIYDNLIPSKTLKIISSKFINFNLNDFNNITRIKIWENTINLIIRRPIFGFGAGIFPFIYLTFNEDYMAEHSHNIILQIAFEYGMPISILLTFFISFLLFKGWFKILPVENKNNIHNNLIEKCWYASTFVATISQLTDITYFEGRISIIIWILLAGIKCILDDNKNSHSTKNSNQNIY